MMSWGQYIHWASIQYENFIHISNEDCHYSRFIGASSHWLASQYIVIEGWYELKEHDATISKLLTEYDDYVSILKRCRNAVYHYQNKIFDKRIQKAHSEGELLYWAVALQDEFERFLFLYPFKQHGICLESIELHDEYFGCIGWKPTDNVWVKWFDLYNLCSNYAKNNELNELELTNENDLKVSKILSSLIEVSPDYVLSKLSRLSENT